MKKRFLLSILGSLIISLPCFAFDPAEFPGKGNRKDFEAASEILSEGTKLARTGQYRESIPVFNKAIERYPYLALSYYNLGNAYRLVGDFRNAETAYVRAIKLAPEYGSAYLNLSATLGKQKRFPEAEKNAKRALELNPSHPGALVAVGECEFEMGNYQESMLHLKKAQEQPGSERYRSEIDAYLVKLQRVKTK